MIKQKKINITEGQYHEIQKGDCAEFVMSMIRIGQKLKDVNLLSVEGPFRHAANEALLFFVDYDDNSGNC